MLVSFQECTDGSTYGKSVNMIWHINRIKDTNQMTFLVIQKGSSTKFNTLYEKGPERN